LNLWDSIFKTAPPGIRRILALLLLILLTGFINPGCAHRAIETDSNTGPLNTAIAFYRGPLDHLNAVRTGSCPMHPGCSDYSRQAIAGHGPVLGWIMACDRLMRCGRDELERAVPIIVAGQRKYLDPVSRNADWWHHSGQSEPPESYRNFQVLTE